LNIIILWRRDRLSVVVSFAERLARFRVPLGWALGVSLLVLARPTPALLAIGTAVSALGESMRLWASGHLEKNRNLTRSGPYAWTRNPLYLGSFVVGLGFCIASGRPAFVALLGLFFLLVYLPVMRREAERLEESYREEYRSYSSRVPLFLPGLRGPEPNDGVRFSWARVRENREHQAIAGLVLVAAILAVKLAV
jgi:protein-S-isoprenylcysteine O-methyltransferase Ste14